MNKVSKRQTTTAETKSKLFDSALTLFSDKSYAATSIRDIIQLAGVTQPTLYYHFSDKADLFQKLVEHHYGQSQQQLIQLVQETEGLRERLLALLIRSFEFCAADPRIPKLMFQTYYGPSIPEVSDTIETLTTSRFQLVVDVMKQGIKAGELTDSNPEFLALSFCCLMDQPINLFSRKPDPSQYLTQELAAAIVELFLNGAASSD
ncbi:TetR/AcrR family transcriptional regulator [bacterium]|nr:TetR/AcrR family transcriptional regulator [bacterium]